MANLNFNRVLTYGTQLNFGDGDDGIKHRTVIDIRITLPEWLISSAFVYDSNVSRPLFNRACLPFQVADNRLKTLLSDGWNIPNVTRVTHADKYQQADLIESKHCLLIHQSSNIQSATHEHYEQAVHYSYFRFGVWQKAACMIEKSTIWWESGIRYASMLPDGFGQLLPTRLHELLPYERAVCAGRAYRSYAGRGKPWRMKRCMPYQWAVKPAFFWHEIPDVIVPPKGNNFANLNFKCKWRNMPFYNVRLNFGNRCPGEDTKKLDFGRSIIIVNRFVLTDEHDNEIPCISASMSIDKQSFAWSFDLAVPYSARGKVAGDMKILVLHVNNYVWKMLVTGKSEGETFGKHTLNLKGFSQTITLAEPYIPTRTWAQQAATTARQVADEQLLRAGFDSGFELDWQLAGTWGWTLPAESWRFEEKTPIQVLQEIADAGGGFLQSHMNERKLMMLPQYPKPFWQWKQADILLPEGLILSRDLDTDESTLFNGVYVSGENTGVTALVKRTGTAGDKQAPMFVHPLIGDEAAARSKGIAILSSGGKKLKVDITMPLHSDVGLILPNTLVGYGNNIGLSNRVGIDVSWNNTLVIRQNIGIEQHLDR